MKEQSYTSTPPLGPCGLLQGETLPTYLICIWGRLVQTMSMHYFSDSQLGFRGTLGYREHFQGVPRDVEITNIL